MARVRLKMLPFNLLALIGLMAWGTSASSSAAGASTPSPSAEVELICHTDNQAECYPKIFQATDEFQIVHPDQDLPLGLHVRLNINTGQKEAKINVPDEDNPALQGLPVDSSVVVVERDRDTPEQPKVKIPSDAPAYDPVGKIKTPESANSGEGSAFYQSLTILKKGLDVDGALEMLEEISHDIYYGLKIAEDYDTVRELFCLASLPTTSAEETNRARLAALTLASTVQNNPSALSSISDHWPKLSASTCSSSSSSPSPFRLPLGLATFHLSPPPSSSFSSITTPSLLKARISSLRSLLRSPTIRTAFLSSNGPTHLLRLLTTTPLGENQEEEDWDPAQRSAAFLLLDNFLDPDMGAALGEWPTRPQASEKECAALAAAAGADGETEAEAHGEQCWDWHISQVAGRNKGDRGHWSHELKRRVAEQRRVNLKRKGQGQGQGQGAREKVDL